MHKNLSFRSGHLALSIVTLFALLIINTGAASAAGSGIYDDGDPNWTYSSGWSTYAGAGPYNNTDHYTSTVGATASFTFSGTSFTFTYLTASNRGNIAVSVDGSPLTTLNANSASMVWQKTYTSPTLASGSHTVVFTHAGPASTYIDVDAIQIFAKYDDPDPGWIYSGGWLSYAGPGPYNNTLHYTSTVGASTSFVFTGTGFTFTYLTANNRGNIAVSVDGSPLTTLNANTASMVWMKTYTSPALSAGSHTVVFTHAGPASTYIDVDAIQITGGSAVSDSNPPGVVTSLNAVTGADPSAIDLSWIAPPDDDGNNGSGPVASYLVRVSTSTISNETDWNNATPITANLPTPVGPGGAQSMTVSGLIPSTSYSVAVRAQDEASNLSPIAAYNAISSASAISYDEFNTPHSIGSLPYSDNIANVTQATTGIDDPSIQACDSSQGLYTLWYTYTAPADGQLQVDTGVVDGEPRSGYDTVLAVWTGTRGNLTPVTCNDDTAGGNQSLVNFAIESGIQYYIEVTQYAQPAGEGLASAQSETSLVLNVQESVASENGIGVYDDSSPGWTYSSGWSTYAGAGPYDNTVHYIATVGATASITFNGTSFTFTYLTASNRGNIAVSVDGSPLTTLNANSASMVWQKTYTSPVLSAGPHTVVFTHAGPVSKYIDIDAFTVFCSPGATTTICDDSHPGWTYSSGWSTYAGAGPYNNTIHYIATIGAAASFTFSGTGFTFTYLTANNRGNIAVSVDGSPLTTLNANSASMVWLKTYTSPTLSDGTHTVIFTHAGPVSKYIDVDAITIQ